MRSMSCIRIWRRDFRIRAMTKFPAQRAILGPIPLVRLAERTHETLACWIELIGDGLI